MSSLCSVYYSKIALDLKVLTQLRGKPSECETLHHMECPCLFGIRHQEKSEEYFKIMEGWQEIASKVANMDEFNRDVRI